jgi:hypothetical protein
MHRRFFVAAGLSFSLLSRVYAQEPTPPAVPATAKAYTYCTVADAMGGGRADVWVSQVFEFEYLASANDAGLTRTHELATQFHSHVAALGGAGDKDCSIPSTQAAALEQRAEAQKIRSDRFMGLKVTRWHDVQWIPAARTPLAVADTPLDVPQFIYCYATDADIRKSVGSQIFEVRLIPPPALAHYDALTRFANQFYREVVTANRLTVNGATCQAKDTLAEAQKSRKDYRNTFSDFTMPFVDVQWQPRPIATPATAVTASVAPQAAGIGGFSKSYTYCQVHDAQNNRMWISPVVEYEYEGDHSVAWRRNMAMAAEFHALVVASGGAGSKLCMGLNEREQIAAKHSDLLLTMAAQRGVAANPVIYTELQWIPKPWDASMADAASEVVQFVRCEAADVRSETSVVTAIFDTLMPPLYDNGHRLQIEQIKEEFRQTVMMPRRIRDEYPLCSASDTYAEAQKDASDRREMYILATPRYLEIPWTPTSRKIPSSTPAPTANPSAPSPTSLTPVVESNAEVPASKIVPFIPDVATLRVPGKPAVLPTLFGACSIAGRADGTMKVNVSPIFHVANAAGENTAMLAYRYSLEYAKASAKVRKLKHSNSMCELAATRLEIAVRRINLMTEIEPLIANTPGGADAVVASVAWMPAGAEESNGPHGERVPLHIVCTASAADPHTNWYTRPFIVPGADAAAQFEFVKTMHASYVKFVAESTRRSLPLVSCRSSESATDLQHAAGLQANSLAQIGVQSFLVEWPMQESAAMTTADTKE